MGNEARWFWSFVTSLGLTFVTTMGWLVVYCMKNGPSVSPESQLDFHILFILLFCAFSIISYVFFFKKKQQPY